MTKANYATQIVVLEMISAAVRAFNNKEITHNEYDEIIINCNDLMGK